MFSSWINNVILFIFKFLYIYISINKVLFCLEAGSRQKFRKTDYNYGNQVADPDWPDFILLCPPQSVFWEGGRSVFFRSIGSESYIETIDPDPQHWLQPWDDLPCSQERIIVGQPPGTAPTTKNREVSIKFADLYTFIISVWCVELTL